jgi:hypothetical protein
MKEGFSQIQDLDQDRTNPLASQQHPLTNPVPRGIPTVQSDSLRSMSKVAFNVPIDIPLGSGGSIPQPTLTQVSPRMDDANSFLGLVEFCKNSASTSISQGISPFTNTMFSSNCGVCFPTANGNCSLITGETFTTPTGIVVYENDKISASNYQTSNDFNYPRAIPSLKSATCPGAVLPNDDSRVPTLAIDDAMYKDLTNRMKCIHSQSFTTAVSNGKCGQCTTSSEWSYLKSPPEGGMYDVVLSLYGSGNAVVVLNNGAPIQVALSSTVSTVGLGVVIEGTPFQITVNPPAAGIGVTQAQLYGAITSFSPNGFPYNLPIDYAISIDENNNNSRPRMSGSIADTVSMQIIVPAHGETIMVLNGTIPLTFIHEDDQIGYYDCTNGPYVTSSANAEIILGSSSPCSDGLSMACKRSLLRGAKCTSRGSWWTSLPSQAGTTPLSVSTWLRANANSNNPDYAGGCIEAPPGPAGPTNAPSFESYFMAEGRNILDFGLGAVILNQNCMPPVEDTAGWKFFLSIGNYDRSVDPDAFPSGVSYITVPDKLRATIQSYSLYDLNNVEYNLTRIIDPDNEFSICDPEWGSKPIKAINIEYIEDPVPSPPTDIGNAVTSVIMELTDQYVIDPGTFRCSIM